MSMFGDNLKNLWKQLDICELTDAPESRKIYLLRHIGANKGSDDAARIFEKELALFLEERKN